MVTVEDPARKCRVLLIDDNVEACRALAKFLELSGYDVSVANSGADAYRSLAKTPPPDIVLTDLLLPDADGRDIAKQARRLDPTPRIALITGWSIELDPEEVANDFDWIFMKPVDMRSLLGSIRETKAGAG